MSKPESKKVKIRKSSDSYSEDGKQPKVMFFFRLPMISPFFFNFGT